LAQLALALAARGAAREVRLDLARGVARERAVEPVVEPKVELLAGHDASASLSSRRARCSCAFDVPGARPRSCAISSFGRPSPSWSTNTARAPGGSVAIAFSRSKPASGAGLRGAR